MVFGMIGTGEENSTCCQPLVVSLVNVADASRCPDADHRLPMCVPVFSDGL